MNFRIIAPLPCKMLKKFPKIVTEGVRTKEKLKKQMTQILTKKNVKTGFKII